MATSTVEDYIKCLYQQLEQSGERLIPTGRIAAFLDVSPGSATAMIKTLADSGLIEYEPYAGARLTRSGRRLATHVLRRHRIVELFLVEVMGLNWTEVHDEAEVLEHVVSDRVLDRMDEMLGRPKFDPHGDPIPSPKGAIPSRKLTSAADYPAHRPVELMRVTDQRPRFLALLEQHGLMPGRRLEVVRRNELSGIVELRADDGVSLQMDLAAASTLLVEKA